MFVNPLDKTRVFIKTLIHSIAVKEKWKFVFLTNSDDTLFCFYFLYIFIRNYDFRSRNAIIPHREVIVLVCIYVYLYVCRLHYVLCLLGFFETIVTVLMWVRGSYLYGQKDLLPYFDSIGNQTQLTFCYVISLNIFIFYCQIVDRPKSRNRVKICDQLKCLLL